MKGSRRFAAGGRVTRIVGTPPRDPGEPAAPVSPRLAPAGSHRPVMGPAGGPAGSHPRPACLLGEGWRRWPRRTRRAGGRWTLLAVRSHAAGSGGRPAPRGAGDLARAASSRLRRHRHRRRRHRPHCQPTRRRLRSSLPHQEQVNEFGPTGLQPVPTRPAGRTRGGPLGTDQRQDQSCDEKQQATSVEVAMAPGRGLSVGPAARVQAPCGRDPGSPRPPIAPLGAAGSLLVVARGTRPVYLRPWLSAGRGWRRRPRRSRHAGAGGLRYGARSRAAELGAAERPAPAGGRVWAALVRAVPLRDDCPTIKGNGGAARR
jgi:hypothetical protein